MVTEPFAASTVTGKTPFAGADVVVSPVSSVPQAAIAIENARNFERIRELVITDDLTGLYNRRFYEQRVARSLERAQSMGKTVGLLMFDLNDFKEINDTHGHGMGDALLVKLGERLKAQVRDTDLIARLGGDEFVVLMENMRSPEDLPPIAAKLVAAVEQPVKVRNMTLALSVSCGVALYPQDGMSREALEEKADKAMYQAKRRGSSEIATPILH